MYTQTIENPTVENNTETIQIVKELNTLLANYHLYYQKLRNFHWNVRGEFHKDLHKQFESMYITSKANIDKIAEHTLSLNYFPISNFSDFIDVSTIGESSSLIKAEVMVNEILEDNSTLTFKMLTLVLVASELEDQETVNLVGDFIRDLEKSSNKLESWAEENVTE